MSSPMPFDQQAFDQWHAAQQKQVADYLRKLEAFEGDITGEWLWIIPHRAMLGRVWPKRGAPSPKLWVITGVVPTDHVEAGAARNCREAARYFAMRWQLEAARLGRGDGTADQAGGKIDWDDMQNNIARRAEWLHELMQDNRRWTPDGLPLFRVDIEAAQL
ncbi:MAG TPA: DUF4826 family protein [Gammaproteobacteria bacterium]|nr:DUF4826 family protein [Gammaproteobacteria bacterium]